MNNNYIDNDGHGDENSSSSEDQPQIRRQNWQRIITQNMENNQEMFAVQEEIQEDLQIVEQAEHQADLPEVGQVNVEQPETIEEEEPTTSRQGQDTNVIDVCTPSSAKKRKRGSDSKEDAPKSKSQKTTLSDDDDDDDDDKGLTCPICMDSWEMNGEHRLVSLKCGHLFGESCIRRWLSESQRQSSIKVCPQCKATASYRDIRHLYARRVQVVDTSLKEELETERRKNQAIAAELATMKLSHTMATRKLTALQLDYDRLKDLIRAGGGIGGRGAFSSESDFSSIQSLPHYRLYMEKNFEICRDPGCRVLLYSHSHSMLMATQKSAQNLFPGYGVRFLEPSTFRPLNFMHTSSLIIRDLAFSESQKLLSVASREHRVKLFDVRSHLCSSMFAAQERQLWSCALDRDERENFLYTGDLRGAVYIYDLRFPSTMLSEFQSDDNYSPVIHIAAVPSSKTFPSGGFLVCQLTALTFFEYAQESGAAIPTRLNIEGPFLSMHYDAVQDVVLVSARSNLNSPQSRIVLAKLDKVDDMPVIMIKRTIFGSKATPIMTRPTQMAVENNTLIVDYHQDAKQLILHDVRREERVQTMAVNEVIYDICPVITSQSDKYLAALTDRKCRIYKVTTTK